MEEATDIIRTTHRLQNGVDAWVGPPSERADLLYVFCEHLPRLKGWVDIVFAAGLFISPDTQSDQLDDAPELHSR